MPSNLSRPQPEAAAKAAGEAEAAEHAARHNFQTPIDEIDAAARVLDPVIAPIRARQHADSTGGPAPPPPPSGVFLKDFVKCEW